MLFQRGRPSLCLFVLSPVNKEKKNNERKKETGSEREREGRERDRNEPKEARSIERKNYRHTSKKPAEVCKEKRRREEDYNR